MKRNGDSKTALLIVDMQNVFLPMTGIALPNIIKLIKSFSTKKLPVIYTQHGHSKEELTPPFTNQLVRKWGPNGSIATGSKDWKLIPTIQELVGDSEVVAKNTYDAFLGTRLDEVLMQVGLDGEEGKGRLVVVGVMTDCCVDTTARAAFNRGYETLVVADATGSADEEQHERGLKAFGFAFGEVLGTEDLRRKLG